MFLKSDKSKDNTSQGNNCILHVSRKVRIQHAKVVLHYLDGKQDTTKMYIRCKKCTDLHLNYHQFKLEMYVSYIQWLPKQSYQVQRPYADIECKQWQAFSLEPPNTYMDIRIRHAELELVWKDNIVPFSVSIFTIRCTRSCHPSLCCIVKESCSNDCCADSPRCWKCCHTIWADAGYAGNMSIYWLMVHYMAA